MRRENRSKQALHFEDPRISGVVLRELYFVTHQLTDPLLESLVEVRPSN